MTDPKTNTGLNVTGAHTEQRVKKKTHPKHSNASDGFIQLGQNPVTRIYATKELHLSNKIVVNNLNSFQMIGFNLGLITGALLRHRAYESIEAFDKYVEKLILNVSETVIKEIEETEFYLNGYKGQGYDFIIETKPSVSKIKLINASSNLAINLFMQIDQLITNLGFLEKCNHFSSTDKILFERQWANLPREVNKKILSLSSTIEKRFQISLRDKKNSGNQSIEPSKLEGIFTNYRKTKSKVDTMKFKPIPDKCFAFGQIQTSANV